MTKQVTVHFCTYRNAETKGQWHKSREYPTVDFLLRAMTNYLAKFPNTTVSFQTRKVYTVEQP